MKKNSDFRLRAMLLTTVSGLVLLSGCQTYKNMRASIFHERPDQEVEGERRIPVLNQGMAGRPQTAGAYAPPPVMAGAPAMAAPAPAQAPVAAAKPQGSTPFDMYDESGNAVDPSDMPPVPAPVPAAMNAPQPAPSVSAQAPAPEMRTAARAEPKLVTEDDARFVSNNNMNPPATGANEKDSPGFFDRLFGKKEQAAQYQRKPIPGNPQYDSQTSMVAPLPQGPLGEAPVARDAHLESPSPMAEPVEFSGAAVPEPTGPLLDSSARMTGNAYDSEMSNAGPVAAIAPPPRSMPVPQGAIPLVEAMPVDPDEYRSVPQSPSAAPARETVTEPLSSIQPEASNPAVAPAPVPEAAPESVPVAASQEKLPEKAAANDDDMFMPVTDFKTQEEGTTVTVSSLADKKPEKKTWLERQFSADEKKTGSTAKPAKPNWFDRQFGSDDHVPEEQKKDYPSFSSVPPNPQQFQDIQGSSQQQVREMESVRDQAQESRMELNSEPSGNAMVATPQAAPAAMPAPQPVAEAPAQQAPLQPQLLGHISSPPQFDGEEGAPVATSSPAAPVAMEAPAPRGEFIPAPAMSNNVASEPVQPAVASSPTPLVAPMPMPIDGSVPPQPEMAQPAAPEMPVQPAPEMMAAEPASDEMPDSAAMVPQPAEPAQPPAPQMVMPAALPQPEAPAQVAAPAPVTLPPPEAVPVEQAVQPLPAVPEAAPAAGTQPAASALPSPALLQKVKVLPPSRYENRRTAQ